jgi:predicted ATPase
VRWRGKLSRNRFTSEAERRQDFAETKETFHLMNDVYQELGYEVIEVPKA